MTCLVVGCEAAVVVVNGANVAGSVGMVIVSLDSVVGGAEIHKKSQTKIDQEILNNNYIIIGALVGYTHSRWYGSHRNRVHLLRSLYHRNRKRDIQHSSHQDSSQCTQQLHKSLQYCACTVWNINPEPELACNSKLYSNSEGTNFRIIECYTE